MSKEYLWWRDGVIYQIYPRSYADSNDDGIGDLHGLIGKLDYLRNWGSMASGYRPSTPPLTRISATTWRITRTSTPNTARMADFDLLLKEAHKRDLHVIMDLVLNHSSDQHPWFVESRKSKDNPYRDWYIWRDPKNGKVPNNWQSIFGGKAWEYDEKTGQYFYHMFVKEQPDLQLAQRRRPQRTAFGIQLLG